MAQVLSPQLHSSPLLGNSAETSRWGDFDYSMIHPAHGISFDAWQDTGSLSQAEQLLSSLGFDKNAGNSNEEEDLFNLDWARPAEDIPMDGHDMYHRQSSSESLGGIVDNDNDSAYDSSTSDSSVETVTPSTSMSLISIHDPALSSFPFPEGATHTSKRRSSATRKEQKAKAKYSPSIQLERISSCHFNPPTLSSQDVPLDATLQQQYNSSSSSSSSYTTRPYWASSSSSVMQASASSSMIRSYSAPTHTQAEYDLLKSKWNAESAAARASAASASTSSSITHSQSSSQLSPTRPTFARRASSALTSSPSTYSSSMGLRKTREYDEASASSPNLSSYASQANEPYSSRTHLLSPVKHSHPFKRSRLAYVSEEIPAYIHKDGASRDQIFGPPASPTNTGGQAASPASPSQITPPKSPNRPSLNRFFTSPEFFVGSTGNDSSDDEGQL